MDARSIADALIVAERERKAISPFTDAAPGLDAETAYRAQRMLVQHRLDAGERIIGAKLGLTSRAKQEAMGVHEPLYGWLTSGMVLPYGEPLPLAEFIHPRVEPEIAFLIGRELEPPVTITGVLDATEAVFAAAEVLDSRYEDFRFRLPDVIADNASGSRIVLGRGPARSGTCVICACLAACCGPAARWWPPPLAARCSAIRPPPWPGW